MGEVGGVGVVWYKAGVVWYKAGVVASVVGCATPLTTPIPQE